jgi:hypothetical protein
MRTSILDKQGCGVSAVIAIKAFGVDAESASAISSRVLPTKQANGTALVLRDDLSDDRYELAMLVSNPKQICGEDLTSPLKRVVRSDRVEVVGFEATYCAPRDASSPHKSKTKTNAPQEVEPTVVPTEPDGLYEFKLRKPSVDLISQAERASSWVDDPTRLSATAAGLERVKEALSRGGSDALLVTRAPGGVGLIQIHNPDECQRIAEGLRGQIERGDADPAFGWLAALCERAVDAEGLQSVRQG